MRLLDDAETIVLVTGSSENARDRERPLAEWLCAEIAKRGDGQWGRRAVITGDEEYYASDVLQRHPTIAIGGPGVNAVTQQFFPRLPMLYTADERVWIQGDFEAEQKRAGLWGADAAGTSDAVNAFVIHGFLDRMLERLWKFRGGAMV